ncbi:MAG: peptidase S8, partial [Chloroflexi bacterium]
MLVKLVPGLTPAQVLDLVTTRGGIERATVPALRLVVVDVPAAQAQAIRARYLKDSRVRSVEVDQQRKTAATPSDPLYSMQWNLPKIGWDNVFGSVTPSGTATIAILDTGVDASHPDLAGRVLPGYSAFAGSNPATDPNGHGTEMAGITVATTDNQTGIAGVAYSGVSIIPVQVLDSTGVGQDSDIVNGVIWAADNGANVILMPFSNTGFSQTLQDAVSYAWSKGVVLIAATGNNGSSSATYPAGDADVVGVSATDQNDALWSGSNYGADTFIAAPGVSIPTTEPGGTYISISGTSASSAMVAGVAAFERAADPAASNAVIVGRLAQDADPAGTAQQTGN